MLSIIFYNPETETNPFRRFRQQVEKSPFQRDFIVLSKVGEKVFHWLLWTDPQMSARGFNTWFNSIRSDIKKKRSRSFTTLRKARIISYEATLYKGHAYKDSLCRNIIAKITGSDPVLKNQYVVMGAHFDHLGVTNGQVFNGAEDNASGSGVVIEVAHLMKEHAIRPKRTVIFCLWTGEELGLVGSNTWVKNPSDGVSVDRVVSYFNMDMVGIGDELNIPGALNFPSIFEVIARDQDADIMKVIKPKEGVPGGSDYSAFIELGIEALALMTADEDGHPDYHDTGDDADKLNPEILRKAAKFVLQGTVNLANETAQPLLIPDRQNLYDAMAWSITVLNSDLKAKGGWTMLEASTPKELADLMIKKVQELKQPQQTTDPSRAMRRRFGSISYNIGLSGAGAFHHDVDLMRAAKEVLAFGRLDIQGDDRFWFDQGVTEQGLSAMAAMRKENIVLHLKSPSKATLVAVTDKARKSFIVTGFTDYDDSLLAKINERDALIGVDFNPAEVQPCVEQLVALKTKLGDSKNLLLNVIDNKGLDMAKRELYQQLLSRGWDKKEIYAVGGMGTSRRSSGNLDVLPRGPSPFPDR